jgi:ribosome maturation factor RimP
MSSSTLEERLTGLLTVPIARLGVELVDVEFTGATLRILVDTEHEPLTGGVDTATLASVNRAIGPILDEADPIPGRYTLEVSSPGVERRLSRHDHYERAIGEDVVVKLHAGAAEWRRLRGRLVAADPDGFTVEVLERDGSQTAVPETQTIDYGDVERTKTVFVWGPAPKPRSNSKKKRGKR